MTKVIIKPEEVEGWEKEMNTDQDKPDYSTAYDDEKAYREAEHMSNENFERLNPDYQQWNH